MKNKGITLVALVITIIVLLILAGVTISLVLGDKGIVLNAKEAKLETRGASVEEQAGLWKLANKVAISEGKVGESRENLLNRLEKEKLLTGDEVKEILKSEKKEITIGSRTISFLEEETGVASPLTAEIKIAEEVQKNKETEIEIIFSAEIEESTMKQGETIKIINTEEVNTQIKKVTGSGKEWKVTILPQSNIEGGKCTIELTDEIKDKKGNKLKSQSKEISVVSMIIPGRIMEDIVKEVTTNKGIYLPGKDSSLANTIDGKANTAVTFAGYDGHIIYTFYQKQNVSRVYLVEGGSADTPYYVTIRGLQNGAWKQIGNKSITIVGQVQNLIQVEVEAGEYEAIEVLTTTPFSWRATFEVRIE